MVKAMELTPIAFTYMTDTFHHLRRLRSAVGVPQQDVAALLGISPTHLIRYEKGHRNPTPEVILTYHILFEANLEQLFAPLYARVTKDITDRSKSLMDFLQKNPSPKSAQRIAYLQSIVNRLNHKYHENARQ